MFVFPIHGRSPRSLTVPGGGVWSRNCVYTTWLWPLVCRWEEQCRLMTPQVHSDPLPEELVKETKRLVSVQAASLNRRTVKWWAGLSGNYSKESPSERRQRWGRRLEWTLLWASDALQSTLWLCCSFSHPWDVTSPWNNVNQSTLASNVFLFLMPTTKTTLLTNRISGQLVRVVVTEFQNLQRWKWPSYNSGTAGCVLYNRKLGC